MPGTVRRGALRPRRRRRDDEGEEEGSATGDVDDVSLSEGSAISDLEDDADVEGSDVSADDDLSVAPPELKAQPPTLNTVRGQAADKANGRPEFGSLNANIPAGDDSSEIEAAEAADGAGIELNAEHIVGQGRGESSGVEVAEHRGQSDTPAQKSRRDHLEYLKQRDSDPAFVPNRGGFFLHDDRSSSSANPPFNRLSHPRGQGRGYGPAQASGRAYGPAPTGAAAEATHKQWAHDLHDSVNKASHQSTVRPGPFASQIPTAKPATHPPNRTFSVTTILGNVTVTMSLPEVDETGVKRTFHEVVKKQYTLLPQHRPPLRRDKPVRISIPDESPRFIFPSAERSFIFIPRAMRPNQQSFHRGRGRGSFHGSRRTSMFGGGSMYTPSVGMSRKSSVSGIPSANGVHTPTESLMRGAMFAPVVPRPVVRMPAAPISMPMPMHMPMSMPMPMGFPIPASMSMMMTTNPYVSASMSGGPRTPTMPDYGGPGPAILQSPSIVLPMHQPQPQKAVSIAEIESPGFKAPQQQQEQPFHQQVPLGMGGPDGQAHLMGPVMAPTTPLSHIPEGAVYAQPFQPYAAYPPQHQGHYYGFPYNNNPVYYQSGIEGMGYMPVGGSMMPPPPQVVMAGATSAGFAPQPNSTDGVPTSMAQETNGTVYYYNQMPYAMDGSVHQYAMGPMMPPPPFYYPSAAQPGVYYPPPPPPPPPSAPSGQ